MINKSNTPLVMVTDAAKAHLISIGSNQGQLLRIDVDGKGCAGHTYKLTWVDKIEKYDESIDAGDDVKFLISPSASMWLAGTVMDWRVDKFESGFHFINPNETHRCGCGKSFGV